MKKASIRLAKALRIGYNFSERLAQAALYTRKPASLTVEKDLKYGDGKQHKMDFVYPTEKKEVKKPVLFYIHGGGWLSGIRKMRLFYCYAWAQEGYFVANLDYTYAPEAQFPTQLQELFNAIDAVLDKAEEYNLDTNRIVLGGESAGGYFVTELAAIMKTPSLFEELGLTFRHRDTFDIKGLISICGAMTMHLLTEVKFFCMPTMLYSFTDKTPQYIRENADKEEITRMSPAVYINGDFPPTMLIYAEKDSLQADTFATADIMRSKNVPFRLFKGTGIIGMHAWPIAVKVKKGRECFEDTLDFISIYNK